MTSPAVEPTVVVNGVAKRFRIPQEQVHTLKERALHPFRHIAFNTFDALEDVSFQVGEGEFFGIVGRNGSGKSTLLKLLAGIYAADAGTIDIRGRMSTFIELGVGFNPDLAAYDNVITNAIMLGLTPKEAADRYEDVIRFAELEEFEDLKIKNYSSGMLVRLAFSVSIEAEADIMLIDEVLAVGDANFQQKCFDQFKRLRDENRTVILVTHDMGMVERFCDRAMLLEKGRIVEIGEPAEVGRRYMQINFDDSRGGDGTGGGAASGDGRATIDEIWLEDAGGERIDASAHGDDIVLKASVSFHAEVTDPLFHFALVNEADLNLAVFDTRSLRPETGTYHAGDTATVGVRFTNALAPGRYEVSMVVAGPGVGFDELHRVDRGASFVAHNPRAMGALVDLPFSLELEHEEAVAVDAPA